MRTPFSLLLTPMKTISVDLDGILCENGGPECYANAKPIPENIKKVNAMYEAGVTINIWTSRRSHEDTTVTIQWLENNGVKYHHLGLDKPPCDLYIDDKASSFLPYIAKQQKDDKRKVLGICLSGGMDSLIAYHYAIRELGYASHDILCLHFDISHPYEAKEKKALDSFGIPYTTMKVDLCRADLANIPDIQHYIIPARNMIFASIMGSLAQTVWIMGMKYENHPLMYDKNDSFFNYASIAMTQATGMMTIVESPFSDMTKTDTIQWALRNGITAEELGKSTSCYHPTKQRCGECSLCFKRNIAMLACGIQEEYEMEPMMSDEGRHLIAKYREALRDEDFSHYQRDRIEETLKLYDAYLHEDQ